MYWHYTNRILNNIIRMVKRWLEKIKTRAPAKGKGKATSVERKQRECYQRKATRQVVSATMRKSTRFSFPAPESQTKTVGKSSKGKALRGRSPSGKRDRRSCRDYIRGKCTNPRVVPPVCQNHKTESGCKFDERCSFVHREADRPNTRPKRMVLKVCYLVVKFRQSGCIFQDVHRRNPIRFHRRAQKTWDQSAACNSQKVRYDTRKEGSIARYGSAQVVLMSVALVLKKLRTGLRKKP